MSKLVLIFVNKCSHFKIGPPTLGSTLGMGGRFKADKINMVKYIYDPVCICVLD